MRLFLSGIITFALLLVSCAHSERELASAPVSSEPIDQKLTPVIILHTNDIHGHAWPIKRKDGIIRGGFAAQAAIVQRTREEIAAKKGVVLVLSAGDLNTGAPESDLLDGEPDIFSMNAIGYDVMVLGNHEFDGGFDKLTKQRNWMKFPVVSGNISSPTMTQRKIAEPFVILEREGIRFGILGLTTDTLKKVILKTVADALEVESPIEASKTHLPALKQAGAQILIGLTHLGISRTGSRPGRDIVNDDVKLAKEIPDFDFIIGGHSHTLLPHGRKEGKTWLAQAGEKGEYLGKVAFDWDRESGRILNVRIETIPILPTQGEDPKIKVALHRFEKKVSKLLDEELGIARLELDGERETVRHKESNLGNFICDVIRKVSKADVAIWNGGGIRASIPRGRIRLRDIHRSFPFRNTVTTGILTGKQLKAALQTGLKNQNNSGSFLQVSGIQYAAQGSELTWVKVRGAFIADSAKYKVASNNFLFGGGDYLDVLTEAQEITDTGMPVDVAVAKYIRAHPEVSAKFEKRIILE